MTQNNAHVVVVGIDYSETAGLALRTAHDLAGARANGELHIVNVVPAYGPVVQLDLPGDPGGVKTLSLDEASHFLNEYSEKRLNEFASQVPNSARPKRIISHLRLNAPAEEIAQLASDLEADLVVVGTHGRRGVRRVLVGSVAERVVRMAHCPVLVVRPKGPGEPTLQIAPPCPRCVEARQASDGNELWCAQHKEKHGPRHTYHFGSRVSAETNPPLVTPQGRR